MPNKNKDNGFSGLRNGESVGVLSGLKILKIVLATQFLNLRFSAKKEDIS